MGYAMTKRRALFVTLICSTVLVAACANGRYARYDKTAIGAGVGALAGAVVGHQLGDGDDGNVAIGAVVGALAGGAVGRYMDNQEHELRRRLQAERAANMLDITRLNGQALKIGIASDASFAVNSAVLSPRAQRTFNKIATVLKNYRKTAIHVVGHTDSTGSAEYNMQLSRERAQSVADFLVRHGVSARRIQTWARGESEPIASNDTAAGRAANRRVDIVIKPIVAGNEAAAFSAPPDLGRR